MTSDGTQFYAPPDANFRKVYAAGQANGEDRKPPVPRSGSLGLTTFSEEMGIFIMLIRMRLTMP